MPKKGQKTSAKTKAKLSAAHKGKKHSPETIEKIRAARLQQDPPNLKHGLYSAANRQQVIEERILALFDADPVNQSGLSISDRLSLRENLNTCRRLTESSEENSLDWLTPTLRKLRLEFTLDEVYAAQKDCVPVIPEGPSERRERMNLLRPLIRLARIYEDCVQKCGNRIRISNNTTPFWKQKWFPAICKLNVIIQMLGLKTEAEIREYMMGVYEAKKLSQNTTQVLKQKAGPFLPLKLLASPLCILDFLRYFRDVWYERYAYFKPEVQDEIYNTHYGNDHYDELLCIFDHNVYQEVALKPPEERKELSRFSIELSFLAYDWENMIGAACSPLVRKLWKEGTLKQVRPELAAAFERLEKERKTDHQLWETCERARIVLKTVTDKFASFNRKGDVRALSVLAETEEGFKLLLNWYNRQVNGHK